MTRTPKNLLLFLFSISMLALSCSEEKNINIPPVADFQVREDLDEIFLTDNSVDEDGDRMSYLWSANSEKVIFSSTTLPETSFSIPTLVTPLDVTVELIVSDL
jgi:hypothetical protein